LNVNKQKIYTDKAFLLDLKNAYWYELDNMPEAQESKGILVDNIFYLVGGYKSMPLREIDSYNLSTADWRTEAKLPFRLERPAIAYHGGIIYMYEKAKILTYEVETKEINSYLIDLNTTNSELFYADNKLYLLGGLVNETYSTYPSKELYTIDLKEFETTQKNILK